MNGILINKAIYYILSNDDTITGYVGNKIFPMIIPTDTTVFPHIVFSRTSITPAYCKDGCYDDTVMVSIVVCDKDYFNSCKIAQAVRDALDGKRGTIQEIPLQEIRLTSVSEATVLDVFVQTLTFTIHVG